MTDIDISAARTTARSIIQRLVSDAAFAERLRGDPRATLLDAGVPEPAVDDFIVNDLGLECDVEGYSMGRCAVTSLLWVDEDGVLSQ